MSEVFPPHIAERAVALSSLAVWTADAILNQLFPIMRGSWGKSMIFYVFAAVLIPQFYFVWKIMPETKGRTLEEIERSWYDVEPQRQEAAPIWVKKPLPTAPEAATGD